MEGHCSPLGWPCFYQDEGIEDLRHYLLYTTELETAIVSAKEEITRRELEIFHLRDVLTRTIKERNDAQIQCQKLVFDKLALQQQLVQKQQENQQQEMQQLKQESAPLSGTCSSEDESKASDSNNQIGCPEFSDPIPQKPLQSLSSIPEAILKLAADKPLPEKGKLLQAVKEAGPLLQTLLLAGPLPQWQHPPPQLDSIEIPPVTISSPTPPLIHQDSFNSFTSCLSKKRDLDLCEGGPDSSSPTNKHQKVVSINQNPSSYA